MATKLEDAINTILDAIGETSANVSIDKEAYKGGVRIEWNNEAVEVTPSQAPKALAAIKVLDDLGARETQI